MSVNYKIRKEITMKTAAKVFIIISMIVGALYIYPLVLGFIVLKKLNNGTMTTAWKIVTLLLVNTIAGILLLCMPAEEAAPVVEATAEEVPAVEENTEA